MNGLFEGIGRKIVNEVPSATGANGQHPAFHYDQQGKGTAGAHVDWHKADAVLVPAVQLMKRPEEVVPSWVWLRGANEGVSVSRELFLFTKGGLKFVNRFTEREREAAFGTSILDRDGAQYLVQRRAQIVEDFASDNGELSGQRLYNTEPPYFLAGLRVVIGNGFIWTVVEEGADALIEVVDLRLGPFGLGKKPVKRFRLHDVSMLMDQPKDADE